MEERTSWPKVKRECAESILVVLVGFFQDFPGHGLLVVGFETGIVPFWDTVTLESVSSVESGTPLGVIRFSILAENLHW